MTLGMRTHTRDCRFSNWVSCSHLGCHLYVILDMRVRCPGTTPQPSIDAVCILGKGLALYQRSSLGPLFQVVTTGDPFHGWYALEDATPLANLLAWLHTAMPRQLRRESVVRQYFVPTVPQAKYMAKKQSETP